MISQFYLRRSMRYFYLITLVSNLNLGKITRVPILLEPQKYKLYRNSFYCLMPISDRMSSTYIYVRTCILFSIVSSLQRKTIHFSTCQNICFHRLRAVAWRSGADQYLGLFGDLVWSVFLLQVKSKISPPSLSDALESMSIPICNMWSCFFNLVISVSHVACRLTDRCCAFIFSRSTVTGQ